MPQRLVMGGIYDELRRRFATTIDCEDLLTERCRQIEAQGLKLKHAEAAIIDAKLVKKPRRYTAAIL